MTVVSFRKRRAYKRRRRFIPKKRLVKTKSLYPRRTVYIHKGRFRLFKHRDQRTRFFKRFNTYIMPRSPTRSYNQKYVSKPQQPISSFDMEKVRQRWEKNWKKKKKTWEEETTPLVIWKKEHERDRWKRQKAKPGTSGHQPKKPVKPEFKKKINRESWDTSKYRNYTSYGRFGEKDPKLIVKVEPTIEFSIYFLKRQGAGIDDQQTLIKNTTAAMKKMVEGLKLYGAYIINKYVPKDTGDLRKAMLKSINKAKVSHMRFKMVLDTKGIDYAYPVNNMPTRMLRHHEDMKKRGRTGKILHDPNALKGWFGEIKDKLKNKAAELTNTMIRDIALAWMYRVPVTGFIHPPTTTEKKMVESDAGKRKRLIAYESWRKLNKRGTTTEERAMIKQGWFGQIKVIHSREIEVSAKEDDREKFLSQMRERKYMASTKLAHKGGTLYGTKRVFKEPIIVEYPEKIIRGMFKITGLLKGK